MIVGVAVGEVTPGFELAPEPENPEVVTTNFVIAFLMLTTVVIAGIVSTMAGFWLMQQQQRVDQRALPALRPALRVLLLPRHAPGA